MRSAGSEDAEEGIRMGGRILNNLRYADDTTLAAESELDLRSLIERVTLASEQAGLSLNIKKTKVLSNSGMTTFTANNENIEVVDHFVFLGSVIDEDSGCTRELTRRLALGRSAMIGLARIWKDRDLSVATKVRVVKALVFPVATYGCETWTLSKAQRARLEAFEMWCWRRMLRIPWTAKRTNVSVLAEVNSDTSLERTAMRMKLAYFGHVLRGQGLEASVMLGMGGGSRGRGRPKKRWLDEVKDVTGRSIADLKEAARDRVGWRSFVRVITRGRLRPDGTK